jgi:[acyl-carrier-protein] S-malonyltransferase
MYELCAKGPLEKLSNTRYTQPVLFTVESAIFEVLTAKGIRFDAAAGHSLGEFSAWHAAGAVGFEDGLALVLERGRLMDESDPLGIGTMAAVIGLTSEEVSRVCAQVGGTVVAANINAPQQVVISGEKEAVRNAGEALLTRGAKRVLPLNVSGAFHSPLMEEPKTAFKKVVEKIKLQDTRIPVYANVTAKPVTKAAEIKKLMIEQLVLPVRWADTVTNMIQDGIGMAYELGPGAVLAGLARRTDDRLKVISISEPSQLAEMEI